MLYDMDAEEFQNAVEEISAIVKDMETRDAEDLLRAAMRAESLEDFITDPETAGVDEKTLRDIYALYLQQEDKIIENETRTGMDGELEAATAGERFEAAVEDGTFIAELIGMAKAMKTEGYVPSGIEPLVERAFRRPCCSRITALRLLIWPSFISITASSNRPSYFLDHGPES
jgi:hypothetical protein